MISPEQIPNGRETCAANPIPAATRGRLPLNKRQRLRVRTRSNHPRRALECHLLQMIQQRVHGRCPIAGRAPNSVAYPHDPAIRTSTFRHIAHATRLPAPIWAMLLSSELMTLIGSLAGPTATIAREVSEEPQPG